MVNAKATQDGGIDIIDVDGALDDVVAEVIGLADGNTRLNSAASQPHGETAWVVIATIILAR